MKILTSLFFGIATTFLVASSALANSNWQLSSHNFQAHTGDQPGNVFLTWTAPAAIENYNIFYGPSPDNLAYSVANIGRRASYEIGGMPAGETWYFALSPVYNGQAAPPQNPVSAVVASTTSVKAAHENQQAQVGAIISSADSGPSNAPWNVYAETGTGKGEVKLRWNNPNNEADGFDIVYGRVDEGIIEHGVQNIATQSQHLDKANAHDHVIGGLESGQYYLFKILPEKSGQAIDGFTTAVVAKAL